MIASENHHDLPIAGSGNFQPHEEWIVSQCLPWMTGTIVGVEGVMGAEPVIIPPAIEVGVWNMHFLHLQGMADLRQVARMNFEEPMIGVATTKACLLLHIRHHRMRDILMIGGEDQAMVAMIVEDTIRTKKKWKIWNDVFRY